MNQTKKICVIGLGYIGLPTAALLANRGYSVHGVDVVASTVDIINKGKIHIVEPDLDTFVRAAVNSGNLKASLTPDIADVFIIAVPTPFHEGYVPNVDYVVSATKAIAPFVKEGDIVKKGDKIALIQSIEISKMTAEYLALKEQLKSIEENYEGSLSLNKKDIISRQELNLQNIQRKDISAKLE